MAFPSGDSGQLIAVLMMAIALGMDAFSLGIGIGMKGIRLLHIAKISAVVALFHVVMPLLGTMMGHYVGSLLGDVALFVGGGVLVLLGLRMIYSALWGEESNQFDYATLWGLLLFAFSVSIDSFSVGISLGMFSTNVLLAILLFGSFGGAMSVLGLMFGRKASHWVGEYGEALGGVILLTFGVKFIV